MYDRYTNVKNTNYSNKTKEDENLAIDKPLLEINNLHVGFRIKDDFYDAVDGVSLTLEKNEFLASSKGRWLLLKVFFVL